MGRKKSFDQHIVVAQMSTVFVQRGFEGTSLDDLVTATGLLRGSLYSEFGSKQGMFMACLKANLKKQPLDDVTWFLLLVAMLELTSNSQAVNEIVSQWYAKQNSPNIATQLGQQLLKYSHILSGDNDNGKRS
ncbi:TetR/AcrR family transcriptional regulator [Leuconostoc palmae]|uniref:TetR/AcrR family transcriptional regulator n=1 Tax=Leuconostoc palmae TaxID=501487 RepID=UPI001C7CC814|nr:helix-turn-helix domain-containing protein [Leuconostoc palmae]